MFVSLLFGIFWRYLTLKFALAPTQNLKFALAPTPTPDASQWNIGGVQSSGVGHVYFMYISCIFHVVCASFSALATRKLVDAKAVLSGIWALKLTNFDPWPLMEIIINQAYNVDVDRVLQGVRASCIGYVQLLVSDLFQYISTNTKRPII